MNTFTNHNFFRNYSRKITHFNLNKKLKCLSLCNVFQQTLSQWNKVFYLSGGICISTGLIYLFFGTSDIQKWNTYESPELNRREMKLMVKKKETDNIPIT